MAPFRRVGLTGHVPCSTLSVTDDATVTNSVLVASAPCLAQVNE